MTNAKKHERSASQDDALRHPSTKRAKEIDTSDNPYDELVERTQKRKIDPKPRNILHWFRSKDIRAEDNVALSMASQKAQESKSALLTVYLFSPADLDWHGTSPARTDFLLESLRLLQEQLREMHIPLVPLVAETRGGKGKRILDFVKEHDVSHVFANFEYEIDELRRDIDLLERLDSDDAGKEVSFQLFHDQTVMEPTVLTGAGGNPIKVFTPYHKAWLAEVGSNPDLLNTYDLPSANDKSVQSKLKDLFETPIPPLPESKHFASKEEQSRIRKLWPAGHSAAIDRLNHFLTKKAPTYAETRSNPALDSCSRLSAYFSAGILSVREALSGARKSNSGANFDSSGDPGIAAWVREIVFREFYRQMLVVKPHNAMNLPQNLKFDFVHWEDDEEGWKKWCTGHTGMPFVDAGMRQLNHEAYMHNRLRMNTASYLRTNLLLDYRRGERYFAEHLVDWDLANNTQGWEPSYTVFNPVSPAEKNDPDGEYIRKWLPELEGVQGKAVFDPFNRLDGAEFEKLGYPAPHVDWRESKERCMQRYKSDMAGVEP